MLHGIIYTPTWIYDLTKAEAVAERRECLKWFWREAATASYKPAHARFTQQNLLDRGERLFWSNVVLLVLSQGYL